MKNLIKKLKDPFDSPMFATATGWYEWKRDSRKKKPILWFLYKTLWEDTICLNAYYAKRILWSDPIYHFKSKYINKFHMVDTGLDKKYYHDPCEMVIPAVEQVFMKYIDEKPWGDATLDVEAFQKLKETDTEYYEGHLGMFLESQVIYNWIKFDRPLLEKTIEKLRDELPEYKLPDDSTSAIDVMMELDDKEWMKEKRKYTDVIHEKERQLEVKNEVMAIRIIKIRESMWV